MKVKEERNLELFKKKEAGATYRQLSVVYGISIQAIYAIIARMRLLEKLKGGEKQHGRK